MEERNFSYSTTVDIIKAKGKTANGEMLMKGVASTPSQDTQGDTLDPKGFELAYFLKNGLINWNHEWKKNPMSIIGKPTSASVNANNELEVEYYLFKGHKMAEEVYALAQAMSANGLQLGLSIEGKVLETDPNDKKKVKKAMITDLAITPHPINQGTVTELAKGLKLDSLIDFEAIGDFKVGVDGRLIVKGTDTSTADAIIPESLDKKVKQPLLFKGDDGEEYESEEEIKKAGFISKGADGIWIKKANNINSIKKTAKELFSKSEFTKLLIEQYPNTTKAQAGSVFNYVSKYKTIKMSTESTEKTVSTEDFNSALQALTFVKAQETETVTEVAEEVVVEEAVVETAGMSLEDMSADEIEASKLALQKGLDAIASFTGAEDLGTVVEEVVVAPTEVEAVVEAVVEEVVVAPVNEVAEVIEEESDLVKSLSTMIATQLKKGSDADALKFEAVGTLIKGIQEELSSMRNEPLEARTVQTTEFVQKPGEIVKGEQAGQLPANSYSVTSQKRALATKLTDVFLKKSEDPTANVDNSLRGDLMAFEASSIITPRLSTFAKSEGISIIA